MQILWVNLITGITLGIALAFEPTEDDTMKRPPRPRDQPLLSGELIWHIVLVSALFLAAVFGVYAYAGDRGYAPDLARTMALNTLVVLEIFHLVRRDEALERKPVALVGNAARAGPPHAAPPRRSLHGAVREARGLSARGSFRGAPCSEARRSGPSPCSSCAQGPKVALKT